MTENFRISAYCLPLEGEPGELWVPFLIFKTGPDGMASGWAFIPGQPSIDWVIAPNGDSAACWRDLVHNPVHNPAPEPSVSADQPSTISEDQLAAYLGAEEIPAPDAIDLRDVVRGTIHGLRRVGDSGMWRVVTVKDNGSGELVTVWLGARQLDLLAPSPRLGDEIEVPVPPTRQRQDEQRDVEGMVPLINYKLSIRRPD